ncbi:MAG: hypothetical protein M3092_00545 [Actinomycetia bacterium]|nr:hypothetical protein [Actinomycetes bacterium]
MLWKKKAKFVEWKLTGEVAGGLGAIVYLSAAPMITVHEIADDHRTYEDVAEAVEQWVSSVPQQYRLNEEFEKFKELARELDVDDGGADGEGPFGRFNR